MRHWVLSISFALRFLFAANPGVKGKVLAIVYRVIETHLNNKAGLMRARAKTDAVTLVQRFGSALNLNTHFHMLFLYGLYLTAQSGPCFRRIKPPAAAELDALIYRTSNRVGGYLYTK